MTQSSSIKLKAILFDFDGTLVDTKSYYFGIIADYLGSDRDKTIKIAEEIIESKLVPEDNNIRWEIVRTSYQVSRKMGFGIIRSILALWHLSRNHSKNFSSAEPTKDTIEGLVKLNELGVHLGIISYTSRRKIEYFLSKYIENKFMFSEECILAKGDFGNLKEKGIEKFLELFNLTKEKHLCAIVGDLGGDIISGNNLGITTIGLTTGYATSDILSKAGPSRIFDTVIELAKNVEVPSN